jgi:hypothetical protein
MGTCLEKPTMEKTEEAIHKYVMYLNLLETTTALEHKHLFSLLRRLPASKILYLRSYYMMMSTKLPGNRMIVEQCDALLR